MRTERRSYHASGTRPSGNGRDMVKLFDQRILPSNQVVQLFTRAQVSKRRSKRRCDSSRDLARECRFATPRQTVSGVSSRGTNISSFTLTSTCQEHPKRGSGSVCMYKPLDPQIPSLFPLFPRPILHSSLLFLYHSFVHHVGDYE